MDVDWELREAGPLDAEHTVLLLPGGMCSAGSYAEVMAEPAPQGHGWLPRRCPATPARRRLMTTASRITHGSRPNWRRGSARTSWSGSAWVRPSPSRWSSRVGSPGRPCCWHQSSAKDEPAFFRAIVRLGSVLGSLPAAVLAKGAASMVKRIPVSAERQEELREDFRKNVPQQTRQGLREYLQWLNRQDRPAERLCRAQVPTWIVHAEKGDGGLTDDERGTLEACPHAHLVTIPGTVFFLPNEVPEPIADMILEAVRHAG
jgi:pimeloyl-ACP methyl ester carboxylesterase